MSTAKNQSKVPARRGAPVVRYGVAIIDGRAVLFRATHVSKDRKTRIIGYEPLLAFVAGFNGDATVLGNFTSWGSDAVDALRARIRTGWAPSVTEWFSEFFEAYEAGEETGAALPPWFGYEVCDLETESGEKLVWIRRMREPEDGDETHVVAWRADGTPILDEAEFSKIRGDAWSVIATAGIWSLSEAVAEAERGLAHLQERTRAKQTTSPKRRAAA